MGQIVRAEKAVKQYLKVDKFIDDYKKEIFLKLEECDFDTKDLVNSGDLMFITEIMPMISGIIHVGSTIENFKKAKEWVRRESELPNVDAVSVLTALTLFYIVAKGTKLYSNSDEKMRNGDDKKVVWNRICKRTKTLISDTNEDLCSL